MASVRRPRDGRCVTRTDGEAGHILADTVVVFWEGEGAATNSLSGHSFTLNIQTTGGG